LRRAREAIESSYRVGIGAALQTATLKTRTGLIARKIAMGALARGKSGTPPSDISRSPHERRRLLQMADLCAFAIAHAGDLV
jgi:hypothetical protein